MVVLANDAVFHSDMLPLTNDDIEYVGLVPAGGRAERISPLPCSKEIFPVGFGEITKQGQRHPKVAAHYLLEKMHLAGAKKAFIVLRKGKWDIPAYFGNGAMANLAIGYLITDLPYGVPFTLDSAFPFTEDKQVLFGFPDILLQPDDVYVRLLDRMRASHANIVLGLFLAENPQKMDMVDLDSDGKICGIHIKPAQTDLKWTWIIAVWDFTFSQFMHDHVHQLLETNAALKAGFTGDLQKEVHIGDVIQAAIESGLSCDNVLFPQGRYIDIGTPEDMASASHFIDESRNGLTAPC
jgi:glucose-1-phosphate thymidylyltransferase